MRRLAVILLVVTSVFLFGRGAVPCSLIADQPACLVAFHPGPIRNAFDLIEIGGATTSESDGELLVTTVLLDHHLSLTEWIDSLLDGGIATYDRELLFPSGIDEDEVDRQNALMMQDSQLDATLAALRAAGYEVSAEPIGLSIAALASEHRIGEGDLDVGDLLVSVEGEPVVTIDDIVAVLGGKEPGDTVTVTRRRGDEEPTSVTVELVESPDEPGRPLIGVLLANVYDLPVDIDIEAGNIGGPSAGLMFALSIVDSLLPDDLTSGLVIAGTGTIDQDGLVGPIGGIRQKVLGAIHRSDDGPAATVFLVPEGNFAEARGAPVDDEILLVPVASVVDALEALEQLRAGATPARAVAIGG